jgi:NAD(P)-dependent dehydrogenase (short-subunit alcohol dehydrogenase family)
MPQPNPLHSIITGGTGALGSAVVARLLDSGHTCHIPCHKEEELKRFPFTTHDRVKITIGIDLTDEPSVEKFYAGINAPLWSSIHIAGGFAYGAIETVSKQAFVAMMQQNALTCFLCCREAVKRMSSGGVGGRIVNVAARPAVEPRTGANMVPYTASKSAVAAITQALAEEVVARGILVNAVLPSIMDTPANRASMPTADFTKWPKVEQVAATAAFLASPENTVTRGGLIPVYGAA